MRRLFVGLLVTLGSLTLILILAGAGLWVWLDRQQATSALPERFVLEVDLRQSMPLATINGPVSFLNESQLSLDEFILKLRQAETDPRVAGLLIRLAETNHGFARAQEMRDAIKRFGATSKVTAAWADSFGELTPGNEGYFIAAATNDVGMQPGGYLGLTGIAFELPFFRGLLAKLGIEPAVFRRSEYKTALDSFSQTGMSEANAEMMGALSIGLFDQLTKGIATDRDLTLEAVEAAIDQAPLAADLAMEKGMLDRLAYWPEFRKSILDEQPSGTGFISMAAYDRQFGDSDDGTSIGIISLEGNIIRGSSGFGDGIAADKMTEVFEMARNSDISGLVVRIDSGGGSAVASETIAYEIRQTVAAGKPVIISMLNAAASGAYWIAVESDLIIAQPGTFTGSIGVIAGKPVLTKLLDKLEIEVEGVSQGRFARLWSIAKDLDAIEADKIDTSVEEVYERFKAHVGRNREFSREQTETLARGRVWLGSQAFDNSLIDRIGGLTVAVGEVMNLIGVDPDGPVKLERFPKSKSWHELLAEFADQPFGLISAWISDFWQNHVEIGMVQTQIPTSIR